MRRNHVKRCFGHRLYETITITHISAALTLHMKLSDPVSDKLRGNELTKRSNNNTDEACNFTDC